MKIVNQYPLDYESETSEETDYELWHDLHDQITFRVPITHQIYDELQNEKS